MFILYANKWYFAELEVQNVTKNGFQQFFISSKISV